jgi:hypothetical protein
MLQDGVGAVIGAVERWNDSAAAQPDEGGTQQLVWQLGQQLGAGIVPGQGKSRSILSFRKCFNNCIHIKFISMQKSVGQENWSAKNFLSQGKISVFPWLCTEAEEFKR